MTDQEYANDIRTKAQALRDSIVAAETAGLTVHPPLGFPIWLATGHAPGEPERWTIKRASL